jgi:hypothetical protein
MPKPPRHYEPVTVEFSRCLPAPLVKALADKFGFRSRYPLAGRLHEALAMYEAFRDRDAPSPLELRDRHALVEREVRAVLAGADRHAALANLLAANPGSLPGLPVRFEHLRDADGRLVPVPEIELRFEPGELAGVLVRLEAMKPHVFRRRPPVSGDAGLRILVVALARIWKRGTGRRPSIVRNQHQFRGLRAGPPAGPFLEFMSEVLSAWGIRAGKTDTKVALTGIWERARKHLPPE